MQRTVEERLKLLEQTAFQLAEAGSIESDKTRASQVSLATAVMKDIAVLNERFNRIEEFLGIRWEEEHTITRGYKKTRKSKRVR